MTTADKVIAHLQSRPELELQPEKNGRYRLNSPVRPGSNSHAFTLTINDGEHGAFYDHNPQGGPESGTLYDLARQLGIEPPKPDAAPPAARPSYSTLAEYAQAHGVNEAVFTGAGWQEVTKKNRPALSLPTQTGPKYRFLDGKKPKYQKAGPPGWYGLKKAVKLAQAAHQPLIFCNGEASTVVGQHYGLAAVTTTGGEGSKLSEKHKDTLLAELQAAYTGPVLVALDCDKTGRANGPKLAAQLTKAGLKARAVDLAIGHQGEDLADFCRLYGQDAAAKIQTLSEVKPPPKAMNDRPKSEDWLPALQSLGYAFRLNTLDDTLEVNEAPITDIVAAEIRTRMRDIGYAKYLPAMEDAYMTAAKQNPYHPVKAYLQSLKYNSLPQIDVLSSYFQDKHGIFGLWLKKWLVGSIAKIYGYAQNPMLVLDGVQGGGKSHFAAWLCPLPNHFVEGAIQPESNDHKIMLATTWLWEVSELGATTRKADREALKAFITLKTIKARKPYGRLPIHKPAMASFIGTVNDEAGFLNDPTGNRRFLSCTLTKIDWDYTVINVDDIWAEAYHLYRTGYNWRLTTEEKQLQIEINQQFEIEDPWIPEILRNFIKTDTPQDFVSSKDILVELGKDFLETSNTMRLARAMKKIGIEKGRDKDAAGNRVNGYSGLKCRPQ